LDGIYHRHDDAIKMETNYRKLTPKRRVGNTLVTATTYQLWLGDDHLLHIYNERYSESYKRFYFKDIQAFVITQNSRRMILSYVHGAFMLLLLALCLAGLTLWKWEPVGYIICGIIAVPFLISFIVNFLLGPTCTCGLQTSVQRESLPSIKRFRGAQKILNTLRPLIESVQGQLPSEELQSHVENLRPTATTLPPVKPLKHEDGKYHAFVFYSLFVNGAVNALDIFVDHILATLLCTFTGLTCVVLLIIALIRQHGTNIPQGVRVVLWSVLGYSIIEWIVSFILRIYVSIHLADNAQTEFSIMQQISKLSPWELPWLMGSYVFSILASLFLGALGLILLKRFQSQTRALV
jgi:hypothetical protein